MFSFINCFHFEYIGAFYVLLSCCLLSSHSTEGLKSSEKRTRSQEILDGVTVVDHSKSTRKDTIDCGDPGFVDNALRTEPTNFTFGTMVSYRCKDGYKADGAPFVMCTKNGRWNRPLPKCVLNTCTEFKLSTNDTRLIEYSDSSLVVGTKAKVRCKKGYRSLSASLIEINCEWSGNWTSTPWPTCVKYCRKSSPVSSSSVSSYSGLQFIPKKTFYSIGETVLARCPHSYEKISLTCTVDGSWDKPPPSCPVPKNSYCPGIKSFPNGFHNGSGDRIPVGFKIVFKCGPDYFLRGPSWITCISEGKYTGKVPYCALIPEPSTAQDKSHRLTVLLTCILIVVILILLTIFVLVFRWRQRTLQREHWRRYFGNYTYRQSKTNIYHNNQEMKLFKQNKIPAVPVTDL